jgi:cation diffusion facilitator family transporter
MSDCRLHEREYQIKKVLWITLGLNLIVATIKIVAGHYYRYLSLSSSGIESVFDGSSNVLALISITLAARPSDDRHHYGHHKHENLGSIIISLMLFASALQLGFDYKELIFEKKLVTGSFGVIPVVSILVSMAMSFFVSTYERREGERLNSTLLLADSDHTFGDMILSFGVLLSILFSYFHFYWPDIIIGILIIIYLIYLGIKIVRNNLGQLLDAAPVIEDDVLKDIENMPDVHNIHRFRARGNSHWMQVDFHLLMNPNLSLVQAHDLSHHAEDKLRERLRPYCQNVDILIHIEPYEEEHMD